MKAATLIRILLLTGSLGITSSALADTLTIVIENITESMGTVQIQVLAGEAQFDGEQPIRQLVQEAETGSMHFVADDLPSGEYAIRVMNDINGNDKLDANFVGMPTEPWGFSNNASGTFGPAKWEDARFELQGEVTQVIILND